MIQITGNIHREVNLVEKLTKDKEDLKLYKLSGKSRSFIILLIICKMISFSF